MGQMSNAEFHAIHLLNKVVEGRSNDDIVSDIEGIQSALSIASTILGKSYHTPETASLSESLRSINSAWHDENAHIQLEVLQSFAKKNGKSSIDVRAEAAEAYELLPDEVKSRMIGGLIHEGIHQLLSREPQLQSHKEEIANLATPRLTSDIQENSCVNRKLGRMLINTALVAMNKGHIDTDDPRLFMTEMAIKFADAALDKNAAYSVQRRPDRLLGAGEADKAPWIPEWKQDVSKHKRLIKDYLQDIYGFLCVASDMSGREMYADKYSDYWSADTAANLLASKLDARSREDFLNDRAVPEHWSVKDTQEHAIVAFNIAVASKKAGIERYYQVVDGYARAIAAGTSEGKFQDALTPFRESVFHAKDGQDYTGEEIWNRPMRERRNREEKPGSEHWADL